MSEQRLNRSHSLVLEFGQDKAHQTPEEKKTLRAVHFYFLVGQAASARHCKTTRKDKTNSIFITLCPSPTSYINILWDILPPSLLCFPLLVIIPFPHLLLPLQRRTMAPVLDLWLSPLLSHDIDSETLSC